MSFSENGRWKKMLYSIIYLKALCSYCFSSFVSFTPSLFHFSARLPTHRVSFHPACFLPACIHLSLSLSQLQTFMWRGCSVYRATAWDRQPWGRCWILEQSWIWKRVISTPMMQLQYSRPTWESCQSLCSHTGTITLTWRLEVLTDTHIHLFSN